MNETANQQQNLRSSSRSSNGSTSNGVTGTFHNQIGSIASRTSSSSGKSSSHSLHGALTQEILKRNEVINERQNKLNSILIYLLILQRRENGTGQGSSSSQSRDESYENSQHSSSSSNELQSSGQPDQKKSLFNAGPIIDDEKRQQHEQLIEEFKRAHRKMFAQTTEEGSTDNKNTNTSNIAATNGMGTIEQIHVGPPTGDDDDNEANNSQILTNTTQTSSLTITNSHFPRGGVSSLKHLKYYMLLN